MIQYTVTAPHMTVESGLLALTPAQFGAREHALRRTDEPDVYLVVAPAGFKRGEVFSASVPPHASLAQPSVVVSDAPSESTSLPPAAPPDAPPEPDSDGADGAEAAGVVPVAPPADDDPAPSSDEAEPEPETPDSANDADIPLMVGDLADVLEMSDEDVIAKLRDVYEFEASGPDTVVPGALYDEVINDEAAKSAP